MTAGLVALAALLAAASGPPEAPASAEAFVTACLGSTYTQIVSFSLVIASLTVMPNGLFGRAGVRKV